MSVRVGIDESGGETAFHRHRLLDGRVRRFHAEGHHFGGKANVIDAAEVMTAQTALAVENQRRRRALDLIGRHGRGDRPAVDGILGDREREPVLGRKAASLSAVCVSGSSKAVLSPITTTSSSEKPCATRSACGRPCLSDPGQWVWKAVSTTTRPLRLSSGRGSGALSQVEASSSGGFWDRTWQGPRKAHGPRAGRPFSYKRTRRCRQGPRFCPTSGLPSSGASLHSLTGQRPRATGGDLNRPPEDPI